MSPLATTREGGRLSDASTGCKSVCVVLDSYVDRARARQKNDFRLRDSFPVSLTLAAQSPPPGATRLNYKNRNR